MIAHEENPHMLTILKIQGVLVLPRKPYFDNLFDGEPLFIVEINLTFLNLKVSCYDFNTRLLKNKANVLCDILLNP